MVYDLRHERTGNPAPINADPLPAGGLVPRGNIDVDLVVGTYRVLTARELGEMEPDARARLRLNHYVTCGSPKARKGK